VIKYLVSIHCVLGPEDVAMVRLMQQHHHGSLGLLTIELRLSRIFILLSGLISECSLTGIIS
jgi:hypothetical protein